MKLLEQISNLVILTEAKLIRDYRHENVLDKFPYWPAKDDPQYIDPSKGFHFVYLKGELILNSTANTFYSSVVAKGFWKEVVANRGVVSKAIREKLKKEGTDLWNQFGGLVSLDDKTITISKENADNKMRQRTLNDIKEVQAALKNLKRFGVTDDFKIKGVPSPHNGMSVGAFLKLEDATAILNKQSGVILYHGTSKKRWDDSISKQGLRPGNTGDAYNDLIKGYSEFNVYLGTSPKVAEFYGKRQAAKDGDDKYVVLKVKVPDPAKFVPDDHFAGFLTSGNAHGLSKMSIQDLGSIGYKGRIAPQFLEVLSTKKA